MGCNNCNRNYRQNYQQNMNRNMRNPQMRTMPASNMNGCGCNQNMGNSHSSNCSHHEKPSCESCTSKPEQISNDTTSCPCAKSNTGCDRGTEHIDKMRPAMAYVSWQQWRDIYDMEKALCCGTIFEELNMPYVGRCKS